MCFLSISDDPLQGEFTVPSVPTPATPKSKRSPAPADSSDEEELEEEEEEAEAGDDDAGGDDDDGGASGGEEEEEEHSDDDEEESPAKGRSFFNIFLQK